MDPQHRILLQTAYRSLEDAGYVPDSTPSFARETFGCFIGNATLDYTDNLQNDIDVYYSPGAFPAGQWYFFVQALTISAQGRCELFKADVFLTCSGGVDHA